MKVGFFGGSFDPIHLGHINLAIHFLEKCGLDQILFCPAFCSPFKVSHPPKASGEMRLKMIEAAIKDIPQFEALDFEIERKTPSFTIDTIRYLSTFKNELYLLLSIDVASHLHEWKNAEELIQKAHPLIGLRNSQLKIEGPWAKKLESNIVLTPCFDISSSFIRERLKNKLFCGHLLQKSVLDIIMQKELYS